MPYAFLADVLVAIHAVYVSFVVFGLLLIWIGIWRRWGWVRNPWFRLAHLLAIGVVALEAVFGIECPLTAWERELRTLAGQDVDDVSFVGRLLHRLIFYDVPSWVLTICHVGFGLLVAATLLLAPPRWSVGRPARVCG